MSKGFAKLTFPLLDLLLLFRARWIRGRDVTLLSQSVPKESVHRVMARFLGRRRTTLDRHDMYTWLVLAL